MTREELNELHLQILLEQAKDFRRALPDLQQGLIDFGVKFGMEAEVREAIYGSNASTNDDVTESREEKLERLLKMAMVALEYCAKPDSTHRISRSTETLADIRKELGE